MPRRKQSNPRRVPRMFQRTTYARNPYFKRNQRRKKAYAPKRKARFIRKSNPIAENKQVEGSQLTLFFGNKADGYPILNDFSHPPVNGPTHADAGDPTGAGGYAMNSPHWHFNPDSAMYQTHGFDDSQMVGRSVYQRMCAAKFLIKWPQPTMNTGINKYGEEGPDLDKNINGIIPEYPMSYKLYWGFVPVKMGLTGATTPAANKVTAVQIEDFVNERVRDYFNERLDRIAFIPKTTSTINIIGSKTLTPRRDESLLGRLPTSIDPGYLEDLEEGSIPDTLVKITWPLNRKIHFEPTSNFSGDHPAANENDTVTGFYKNYDYMPFAVIVSWNHDKLPEDSHATDDTGWERTRRCPQVLVNDITYYRDQ